MYVFAFDLLKDTLYHAELGKLSNTNKLVCRATESLKEAKKFETLEEAESYKNKYYNLFKEEFNRYEIKEV